MRRVFVIGIGIGDPEQVTAQAISALNQVDVFFVADKGEAAAELSALRAEICRRYITGRPYRIVELPDPARDRSQSLTSSQYREVVRDWHDRRVAEFERIMLAELQPDQNAGFLVWGDPALYDSTIRIVDGLHERGALDFTCTVIPGISSVQALAAAHRIVLNRIGEPVHITTGRRLRISAGATVPAGLPAGLDNVVVMLDADLVCRELTEPGLTIHWGAYLGTPDEILVSGVLTEVIGRIEQLRSEARARKGWIMDTYLLRRPVSGS